MMLHACRSPRLQLLPLLQQLVLLALLAFVVAQLLVLPTKALVVETNSNVHTSSINSMPVTTLEDEVDYGVSVSDGTYTVCQA